LFDFVELKAPLTLVCFETDAFSYKLCVYTDVFEGRGLKNNYNLKARMYKVMITVRLKFSILFANFLTI